MIRDQLFVSVEDHRSVGGRCLDCRSALRAEIAHPTLSVRREPTRRSLLRGPRRGPWASFFRGRLNEGRSLRDSLLQSFAGWNLATSRFVAEAKIEERLGVSQSIRNP